MIVLGMKGILNAQMNLTLASKVQHSANMTVSDGRILERQGITDANEETIKRGQELQAKGEEIRIGVFEYLDKANENITAAAEEYREAAKEQSEFINDRIEAARENRSLETSDEDNVENPTVISYKPGDINIIVSDAANSNANITTPAYTHGKGNKFNDIV